MTAKRMLLHSRRMDTVLYCCRMLITKDQKFHSEITVGPIIVQKVLPNENYIVRRLNTN